jgi:hypothetical protein
VSDAIETTVAGATRVLFGTIAFICLSVGIEGVTGADGQGGRQTVLNELAGGLSSAPQTRGRRPVLASPLALSGGPRTCRLPPKLRPYCARWPSRSTRAGDQIFCRKRRGDLRQRLVSGREQRTRSDELCNETSRCSGRSPARAHRTARAKELKLAFGPKLVPNNSIRLNIDRH